MTLLRCEIFSLMAFTAPQKTVDDITLLIAGLPKREAIMTVLVTLQPLLKEVSENNEPKYIELLGQIGTLLRNDFIKSKSGNVTQEKTRLVSLEQENEILKKRLEEIQNLLSK